MTEDDDDGVVVDDDGDEDEDDDDDDDGGGDDDDDDEYDADGDDDGDDDAPCRTAWLHVFVAVCVHTRATLFGASDIVIGRVAIVGGRPSASPVFDAAMWPLTRRG